MFTRAHNTLSNPPMSRPVACPLSRIRSSDARNPSGLTECVIQPSATSPTRRSAKGEPPASAWPLPRRPALVVSQIGHGDCAGLGSRVTPENRVNSPANGSPSRVHRWRSTAMFSIIRLRRSAAGTPIASASARQAGPAPPPEHTASRVRPPEITSSEAHS